ncbi:MAG: PAS-domain containing protein [Hyphomicrobium sp.]|nr:PAS-domain containing protein [Hyphomicrobium sp.]
MIEAWQVLTLALGYVGLLFAVAWFGDRVIRSRKGGSGRPITYALSLAVYCTSWTFFGSVGLAAASGYDFIPVYLGPILMFVFGVPLILRIVRIAKSQNLTSVADFIAARYGRSQAVAAIATVVSVLGALPYIALQLKAASISIETLLGPSPFRELAVFGLDTALVIALALAVFAVLFGTRHIDATEHQDGLMLAIAAESLVKLAAFLAVGTFVIFVMFGGVSGFMEKVRASGEVANIFAKGPSGSTWVTVTLLSFVCIILLPRQFHVTVVENNAESEIRRASWLFPTYLVLINIFVVPIAIAGLLFLPHFSVAPDMFVLALPMWSSTDSLAMIAFIGGLSAATAMVIVESVALAIMICNGLIVPWLLRRRIDAIAADVDMSRDLLLIRRVSIFAVILLGYMVHRALGQVQALAAIGLIAFAAIAQLAPAFFMGLVWRRGTARGAIAGILVGFGIWAYTLLLPWVARAGWLPMSIVADGPYGLGFLRPPALFYLQFEQLTHGVLWSLIANVTTYVFVSLLRAPEPIERMQAQLFGASDPPLAEPNPSFRLWRTTVTVGDLKHTVVRYLGSERAERSFAEYEASRATPLVAEAEADINVLRFTEHLLTSAIGAASARLVLSLLLRPGNVSGQSALRLLDDASEALQYNRDLLQSALDQVRHGLGVFDRDMRLICWNRQYRELLNLPEDLVRVGAPLEHILRTRALRGDFGPGAPEDHVKERFTRLAVTRETFLDHLLPMGRILEIRTAPMPQGGIVTTYLDITDQVASSEALARANETLERRVAERTAELVRVNEALREANLAKTRFLAAASHDLLQPLNAARLYASSLIERALPEEAQRLAHNVDTSLDAVEEILGALLDISRLDAGKLEPENRPVILGEIMSQLALAFEPMARAKGLELHVVPTRALVHSDPRLLRRVLQNLLSNAIKYTSRGKVIFGVRPRGDRVEIQVWDSGPGIEPAQQALVFKEFHRLAETAASERGLGLGLSIVERIGRVLEAPIKLRSTPGKGSLFSVSLPRASGAAVRARTSGLPPVVGEIHNLRVLCIDNEADVLDGMRALLDGWGCRSVMAASATEALERLGEMGGPPSVILADYHLHVGTGVEAVKSITAAMGREIPAVIITADHSLEVQREIRGMGLILLRKPLKAAQLRAILTRISMQLRVAAE